jgi:acetate kinase
MMATRSGAIDPGVILYLLDEKGMSSAEVGTLLYTRSGLLGVSGISGDMRVLLASEEMEAQEAVALYCYRIARETGSLMAALGGLDAMVFAGGVGENAVAIRASVGRLLAWTGLEIDDAANERGDILISTARSRVRGLVIPTNEEAVIARDTAALTARG